MPGTSKGSHTHTMTPRRMLVRGDNLNMVSLAGCQSIRVRVRHLKVEGQRRGGIKPPTRPLICMSLSYCIVRDTLGFTACATAWSYGTLYFKFATCPHFNLRIERHLQLS